MCNILLDRTFFVICTLKKNLSKLKVDHNKRFVSSMSKVIKEEI